MLPYSIDLRERVLDAYDRGEGTQEELAELFQVSTRWIQKLLAQRQQTGSIAPRPYRQGRKAAITGEDIERLREAVRLKPDATLEELRETLGIKGSIMCIFRALKRLGITRKKKR
jgi:transposase